MSKQAVALAERVQAPELKVQPLTVEALRLAVNLPSLVHSTIERKVDGQYGQTFIGDGFKAKSRVFSAICASVKTTLGLPLNSHLPDDCAKEIQAAIQAAWQTQADALLTFGRLTGSSWNKPKAIYTKGMSGVLGVVATASMSAERDAKDEKEALSFTFELERKAGERLATMLKAVHGKYTAEDIAMQEARIAALAKYHKALTEGLTPARDAVKAAEEAKPKARGDKPKTPPVGEVTAEAQAPAAPQA